MGRVPSLLFGHGQTMVGVMATSFKRTYGSTILFSAPDPAAGHPRSVSTGGPWTHRQVWVSLLWGHCSFLLGPRAGKPLSVSSKGLFPQSCVCSGGSVMELMVTFSKRGYSIPSLLPPEPLPLHQSTAALYLLQKCSNIVLPQSVGSLGPGVHKVCLSPLSVSGGYGV